MTHGRRREAHGPLITGSLNFEDLADCDLVIEAVFENMDVKKDDLRASSTTIAKQGAILATNTSDLNIDEIAGDDEAARSTCIGLHFFSPANVMRLLEVVRGDKTVEARSSPPSMQIAKKIGKIAALVGVCHGFVGNRMLAQRQREAQKLMLEGAMPWDVDRVLYDFGLPMGPFAMSDLAGLDIGWSKETSHGETIRDMLCEMDRRGQKTGAGYYDYDENRNAKPSPVTEKIILDFAAKRASTARAISDEEILERCIYPMINEGAKILEEGKAHPRLRHRYRLDQRLWLARLSRRPDVLWRHDRPDKVLAKMKAVAGADGRRVQAGGAAREARRRGRRVFESVRSFASPARGEKVARSAG